ncbi:MAG: FHA domain-containing protein, partial [Planctomycetes bacterium]|nr:FHA domain-containing protein [Planctomycetota bacterium]
MASVMVKLGDDPRIVPLPAEPITVGRSSQNAIAILDSSLSRVHCELRKVDGAVVVRDLGSRNGTLVNGETVREKKLQSGDKVDVGICRIVVWVEKGGVKLEVSAGKAGAAVKSDGPDTAKLRAEGETQRRLAAPVAGALPDVAAWGKRAGGGGRW